MRGSSWVCSAVVVTSAPYLSVETLIELNLPNKPRSGENTFLF
jgi:hypothetical protein